MTVNVKWHKLFFSCKAMVNLSRFCREKSCLKIFPLQGRDKVLQFPKLITLPFTGFRMPLANLSTLQKVSLEFKRSPVATTSRKRPPLLSDQFSKIPKVSKSNHYNWNLLSLSWNATTSRKRPRPLLELKV